MRGLLLFAAAVLFVAPCGVSAATLEVWPEQAVVEAGEVFSVRVLVSSDQPLNAVAGTLSFPTDLLSATSISKANSVVSIWVQEPSFSNAAGTVTFSGGVPNPGYAGDARRVITIEFRAKQTGVASLNILSGSVLANNGQGTDILTERRQGSVTITEATPSLPQPPAPTEVEPPLVVEVGPREAVAPVAPNIFELLAQTNIPAQWFFLYVGVSLLIIIFLILYYPLGLRIKIYRVKPWARTGVKSSRSTEKEL